VDPRRDFSGPTLRLTHTWNPTGKVEVLTTIRREISPIDEVQSSNFVLVEGVSIKPRWNATEKITVAGVAEYTIWNYRADLINLVSYEHRVRSFGISATCVPARASPSSRLPLREAQVHARARRLRREPLHCRRPDQLLVPLDYPRPRTRGRALSCSTP
jgi:hypothetical protein